MSVGMNCEETSTINIQFSKRCNICLHHPTTHPAAHGNKCWISGLFWRQQWIDYLAVVRRAGVYPWRM